MKHGNKNRSNTRKILNNSNVHTHARWHARAYPPPHTPTHRSGNSFIMTKKGHFHILFYCLNSLICYKSDQ